MQCLVPNNSLHNAYTLRGYKGSTIPFIQSKLCQYSQYPKVPFTANGWSLYRPTYIQYSLTNVNNITVLT